MAKDRRKYNDAETAALLTQVGSRCPVCHQSLFNEKNGRLHKSYDLAHIYPLNPTPAERVELASVERLSDDDNHVDNMIPLCERCHRRFDHPRTESEYKELYAVKKEAIQLERSREIASKYPLESHISKIVGRLHNLPASEETGVRLSYDPKTLDQKLDTALPRVTRNKVRYAVEDYFGYVQTALLEIERTDPGSSDQILAQVRSYYLTMKKQQWSQAKIFQGLVHWISLRSNAESLESAEAVASFFIQNCEVF